MVPPAVSAAGDGVRALTNRLVAGLASRPFRPSTAEIAAVMGSGIEGSRTDGPWASAAAGRYAFLFADHLVRDVTAPRAAGAYARLWLCARRAFLDRRADDPQGWLATDVDAWQNEGGACVGC